MLPILKKRWRKFITRGGDKSVERREKLNTSLSQVKTEKWKLQLCISLEKEKENWLLSKNHRKNVEVEKEKPLEKLWEKLTKNQEKLITLKSQTTK